MDQFICTDCANAIANGDGRYSANLVMDSFEPEFRDMLARCAECGDTTAGDYYPVHYANDAIHPVSFDVSRLTDGTYIRGTDGVIHPVSHATGYYVAECELSSPPALGELFGVWVDLETGVRYVDKSFWIESLTRATQLGLRWKQLAIWDVARNCEIRLS